MPVNGSGTRQFVHNRDFGRLTAVEGDRRSQFGALRRGRNCRPVAQFDIDATALAIHRRRILGDSERKLVLGWFRPSLAHVGRARMHFYSDDQARHAAGVMLLVIGVHSRPHHFARRVGQFGVKVKGEMTVEDPVPGVRGRPGNKHGSAWLHKLGHRQTLLRRRIDGFTFAIAGAIYAEMRAVQVHGMNGHAGVDDTPMGGIADGVGHPRGVRPSFAIHSEDLVKTMAEVERNQPVVPETNEEHTIICRRAVAIHDKRTRHGCITGGNCVDGHRRETGDIVEVCTGRTSQEVQFLGLAGIDGHHIFSITGPLMKAMQHDWE